MSTHMGEVGITIMYAMGLPERMWKLKIQSQCGRTAFQCKASGASKSPTFNDAYCAVKVANPLEPLRIEVWESNLLWPDCL